MILNIQITLNLKLICIYLSHKSIFDQTKFNFLMKKSVFYIPCYPKNTKTNKILNEIIQSILICDKNNFVEAFFGEHIADKHEKISSSLMIAASLALLTKKIKLGTLTTNLNFYHPSILAAQIALIDNLSKGRLILGVGSGSNRSDVELNNLIDENNYLLSLEVLEIVKKLLVAKGLINITSKNFKISSKIFGSKTLGLGYFDNLFDNRKNLECIMPALNPNSRNVKNCAKKGWGIVISNFCDLEVVKNHVDNYLKHSPLTKKKALKKIRLARFIHVVKNKKNANKAFLNSSPYMQVLKIIYKKLNKNKFTSCFGNKVSLKNIAKSLIITGTPKEVSEKIKIMNKEIGEIHNLTYVHVPLANNRIFDDSLKLFSKNVKI